LHSEHHQFFEGDVLCSFTSNLLFEALFHMLGLVSHSLTEDGDLHLIPFRSADLLPQNLCNVIVKQFQHFSKFNLVCPQVHFSLHFF
jgi:hypothetical protein